MSAPPAPMPRPPTRAHCFSCYLQIEGASIRIALNSRHGCPVSGWKPLSSLIAHTCKARLASCSLDLFSVLCFHLPLGPQARSPPVMRDSSFSPGPTFDPPQNLVFCVFFFFPIRSVKPLAFKSLLCQPLSLVFIESVT